jgi:hypothetical protein
MKKLNKSEVIREHLKTAKDKSPVAVAKALKSKGVKVSPGLVSVVKHSRKKGFSAARLIHHADILAQARRFVLEAGGADEAKHLINVVHKIIS